MKTLFPCLAGLVLLGAGCARQQAPSPVAPAVPDGNAAPPPKHYVRDVHALDWSPDGRWIVTASTDGTLTVWDVTKSDGPPQTDPVTKGVLTVRIADRDNPVSLPCVAFSPDSKSFLAGGAREVTLWDAATGKRLRTYDPHEGRVSHVAFVNQGKAIFSSDSLSVLVRDRENDQVLCKIPRLDGEFHVTHLDLSPNERFVLVVTQREKVVEWDLVTGKLARTIVDPTKSDPAYTYATGKQIYKIRYLPDGRHALVGRL